MVYSSPLINVDFMSSNRKWIMYNIIQIINISFGLGIRVVGVERLVGMCFQ